MAVAGLNERLLAMYETVKSDNRISMEKNKGYCAAIVSTCFKFRYVVEKTIQYRLV